MTFFSFISHLFTFIFLLVLTPFLGVALSIVAIGFYNMFAPDVINTVSHIVYVLDL